MDGAPGGIIVPGWRSLSKPHLQGKPSIAKSIANLATVTRIGLDLAKNVFQLHAVDSSDSFIVARSVRRGALLRYFDNLPRCVVAMEPCSSAHHWGRALCALGVEVRLIPPAYVKPYVRRNKNDAADTAAICEAAARPNKRFAALRTVENPAHHRNSASYHFRLIGSHDADSPPPCGKGWGRGSRNLSADPSTPTIGLPTRGRGYAPDGN